MENCNGELTPSDLASLVVVIVVMLSFGETLFIGCAYRYRQTEKSFPKMIMKNLHSIVLCRKSGSQTILNMSPV